jgi:hypothetical protein
MMTDPRQAERFVRLLAGRWPFAVLAELADGGSRIGLCLDDWRSPGALLRTVVELVWQIYPRDAVFGFDSEIINMEYSL